MSCFCRKVQHWQSRRKHLDPFWALIRLRNPLKHQWFVILSCCSHKAKQSSGHEEEGLNGLLKLCTAVMRHDPDFKYSPAGLVSLSVINNNNYNSGNNSYDNDCNDYNGCVCEVGTVGKISHCQPWGPGFNTRPGRGLNFQQPSFTTPSVDRDIMPLV